jgi:cephalosporin hydroxylase
MNPFETEVAARIAANGSNPRLQADARSFMLSSLDAGYSYNFSWLGRPVIQYPQDVMALQELFWRVKPDVVVETGIAHGGSLVFSASMLALLDYCEARAQGRTLDPRSPRRRVVGVDIDIREHNRRAVEAHPLADAIEMIQGSSVDPAVVAQVRRRVGGAERVLVCLDSNHTHEHVLRELEAYAPLVTRDSYCVVFDTIVEQMSPDAFPDRPWKVGDNPATAVKAFLGTHPEFEVDEGIDRQLLLTVAPGGYLRRTR